MLEPVAPVVALDKSTTITVLDKSTTIAVLNKSPTITALDKPRATHSRASVSVHSGSATNVSACHCAGMAPTAVHHSATTASVHCTAAAAAGPAATTTASMHCTA